MRTADGTGSGYARLGSPRLSDIDAAALAERAAKKAETSAKPRDLAPGAYTVILEPEAVADLLVFLLFSLNARTADEGRSFLSKPGGGTGSAKNSSPTASPSAPTRSTRATRERPGPSSAAAAVVAAAARAAACRPARQPGSRTAS